MDSTTTFRAIEPRRSTTNVQITAIRDSEFRERPDLLATEEPLEIRLHGPQQVPVPLTVTMRTPGNDFELAIGLLHNEGILTSPKDLKTVCYCANVSEVEQRYNVVSVELTSKYKGNFSSRSFLSSSACGVCGTTSIEDLKRTASVVSSDLVVQKSLITELPNRMSAKQKVFSQTGGLHGAGIFDEHGLLETVREDIGRHNALDKIVGHYFLKAQLPLSRKILVLSGRVGFELVQKAAVAGIPLIVAVSAPSSLAVQTSQELGITLVGFTRQKNANVYSHPERIDLG